MHPQPTLRKTALAVFCLINCAGPTFSAAHPEFGGNVVLFGNLHAHSRLSDDVTEHSQAMEPANAFKHAKANGLGFLAITDHHKAVDTSHRLSLEADEYRQRLYDVAMQINAQSTGQFVAVPGLEWGETATGNHVNLLGAKLLPPDSIRDEDYDDLYVWAREHCEFVQLNHPNSWKGKSNRHKNVGNFGVALYGSVEEFVGAVDPAVATISVITSVRGGHLSGEHRHSTDFTHRIIQWENYYLEHLNYGFHISPSANQDTHWKNFGTVTAARTAVWTKTATYEDLMAAFRANRVYATEDDEMVVFYGASHKGKSYWLGDTIPFAEEETDIVLQVKIWQKEGITHDSTDEGPYKVEIVADMDGVGGAEASVLNRLDSVKSGTLVDIPFHASHGTYAYVRVTELNGKDNPVGDGDDEVVNATNGHGKDGMRDDLNDTAITSPIWFGGPQSIVFVWSVNSTSKVFHYPDCWAVKQIGLANRRQGSQPPPNWTKHPCPHH